MGDIIIRKSHVKLINSLNSDERLILFDQLLDDKNYDETSIKRLPPKVKIIIDLMRSNEKK